MYEKVKKERLEHRKLSKAFNKHFAKDEDEMQDEMEKEEGEKEEGEKEEDEQVRPMSLYQNKNDRKVSINKKFDKKTKPHSQIYGSDGHSTDENRMYGKNSNSNDEGYDSISPESDEEYYEDLEEQIDEDSQPMLPKGQRKRMAIAVLSRKMSKPKK